MGINDMFNSNKSRSDERQSTQSGQSARGRGMFSVIGPDVVVTGNLAATADLHIDGRIEGDVHCSTLVQGAESKVFGNVVAEVARLAGSVEGSVRVKTLTVERSARIIGDVEYETITIENGGHVEGHMKHMNSVAASTGAAPRALAAPVATEEAA